MQGFLKAHVDFRFSDIIQPLECWQEAHRKAFDLSVRFI